MIRSFLAIEIGEDQRREVARLQQLLKQELPMILVVGRVFNGFCLRMFI